jgi:uncharacterized protein (DUF433 family)
MHNTPVVESHPEILGGEPVFIGTRVPVRALLDYLTEGDTIDSFLDAFPTVTREQVVAFLHQAAHDLITKVITGRSEPPPVKRAPAG